MLRQHHFSQLVKSLNDNVYIETGRRRKCLVHSYGCQQNVSDGEKIKGMMLQMGYELTDGLEDADAVIYNTCAVRENAEDRVLGNVGALKHYKRRNPSMVIGLCGCMTQQQSVADKLKKSYPHVDLVFGTYLLYALPEMLYNVLSTGGRIFDLSEGAGLIAEDLPVHRDGAVRAWLPIMYGCDNFCTYCIVPHVRGRERSRRPEAILAEARQLVQEGYKEITLLGQNVNSYGKGLEGKLDEPVNFSALLRMLNQIPGEFRIRFMTSHPKDCTHELIDTIAQCEKVCNYIHLPVQSGSNRILQEMNRRYTVEDYRELIAYARRTIPGVTFSSDIMVGFPGESRDDFMKTLELVRQVGYIQLFTFIYSRRPGTRAAAMEDPVSEEEKSRWFRQLLKVQEAEGRRYNESLVGKIVRVLVDSPSKSGEGYCLGRTEGNTIVEVAGSDALIGSFVDVKIHKALNWAVSGELVLPEAGQAEETDCQKLQ